MKKAILWFLDELGFFTREDHKKWKDKRSARKTLREERRLARLLKKAKKIANFMHQETNKQYWVMKSDQKFAFRHAGPYYVFSSSEIARCRRVGIFEKHMTAEWLYEHADYFTK